MAHEDYAAASGNKTHEISIKKLSGFHVTDKYAPGHILNLEEASALNQLLRENLRNNYAKEVEGAIEKATKEERALSAEEISALRDNFHSYAATYTFASKREPKAPFDPIKREAHKIASSMVLEALAKKGKKKADLAEGIFDKLISDTVERNINGVMDEAKRRVEATKAAASDSLGDLLGDLA